MHKVTTYADDIPEDCVFLDITEWSMLEHHMPLDKRAEYDLEGYPFIDLESGRYSWMPIEVQGVSLRAVLGERPIKEVFGE